jgi:hypothetical protein
VNLTPVRHPRWPLFDPVLAPTNLGNLVGTQFGVVIASTDTAWALFDHFWWVVEHPSRVDGTTR